MKRTGEEDQPGGVVRRSSAGGFAGKESSGEIIEHGLVKSSRAEQR